jgi:hypothetical protein
MHLLDDDTILSPLWLNASGTAVNCLKAEQCFYMHSYQYSPLLCKSHLVPICAVFPNSPHYPDLKIPVPPNQHVVHLQGFLKFFNYKGGMVENFGIEVISVAFLAKGSLLTTVGKGGFPCGIITSLDTDFLSFRGSH